MPRISRARQLGFSGHDLNGIDAVGLEMRFRAGGATPLMQEDHDLPHDLLLGPGAGDAFSTHGADTGHLAGRWKHRLAITSNTFLAERLTSFLA